MPLPLIAAGIMAAGAAAKAYSDYKANKDASEQRQSNIANARNALKSGQSEANRYYDQLMSNTENYYDNRGSLGTADDINTYREAIANYNPDDYVLSDDQLKFNYDKTKEDFVNPYYDQIIQGTVNSLSHKAAGQGGGRGTGALANIATGVAQKEDELYKTALSEYNTDRSQSYKEFADYTTNLQKRLDNLKDSNKYMTTMYGNMAQSYLDDQDAAMSDKLKIAQDRMSAQNQYATAMAGLV